MDIVKTGQVRAFAGKLGIPEVKPHLSTDLLIQSIYVSSRIGMKVR